MKSTFYQTISEQIDVNKDTLEQVASALYHQPELLFEEYYASQLLTEKLSQLDIDVQIPYGNLDTAFCATIGQNSGPTIAILAEYDALPEIGHACGHNLIAASALGAAIGLAALKEKLPGQVKIIGTPAEEGGGGGKIKLYEAGAFQGIDAAMMFHPFDRNVLALDALACDILYCEFSGLPSHAALNPWDGASALNGVLQHFQLVDNARLHFPDGSRVHGIITNGGQAFNIIPEHAKSEWCIRARDLETLKNITDKVLLCARAAASASHLDLKTSLKKGYLNMINNMTMARIFGEHLRQAGHDYKETDPESGIFSTDMGDLSYHIPSIHPYLAICEKNKTYCHQKSFADFTQTPQGFDTMVLAAKCLAQTATQIILEPELLKSIKNEWSQNLSR